MTGSHEIPVLLMVSGGSDSMALLEMMVSLRETWDDRSQDAVPLSIFAALLVDMLPDRRKPIIKVLHVNHMLRGAQSDEDEAFVRRRCAELGAALEVRSIDMVTLASVGEGGMESIARAERYRLADDVLDAFCVECGTSPDEGLIFTAHTLDDRIETFYMRSLVGTGPGGLSSIPRRRGRLRRPLLDCTREELRDWLRARHPDQPDEETWRDDPTNEDGSNFRSRIRTELIPVLRHLRPGFERSLSRTMDLMADEEAALGDKVESLVYRNLIWDGSTARVSTDLLAGFNRPLARRVLRSCLLVVDPDARLESTQIDRVLDGMGREGFASDLSGGIRVRSEGGYLVCALVS